MFGITCSDFPQRLSQRTRIMNLRNPFRSLTWSSLFQSSRRSPLRRRRTSGLPINVAAEVLEVRSLLSAANVTAAVAGTALTLTSDNNGNHSFEVHRLDATHIEVNASNPGTRINGVGSVVFNLSDVSGITVNLGSGLDSCRIYSAAGAPALNIGAGGILFQGAGGYGDALVVSNDSSNPMSILGNVTVQGASAGKALTYSGAGQSEFDLFTGGSGSLKVFGSVSLHEQGTGSGAQYNRIYTNGAGDLSVAGFVAESQSETSSGCVTNEIGTDGAGSVAIGLGVTQSAIGGTNGSWNEVETNEPGNITVGMGVQQKAICTSGEAHNRVETNNAPGAGNITINYSLAQVSLSSNDDAVNEVVVNSGGNVTVGAIGGGISQTATSDDSGGDATNTVENYAAGTILAVHGGVTQSASSPYYEGNDIGTNGGTLSVAGQVAQSGAGSTSDESSNYISDRGSSPFTISLWATQSGSSTGQVDNETYIYPGQSGSLSIGAWLTQTATGQNLTNKAYNFGTGNFTVGASITQNATATSGITFDYVYADGSGKMTVGAGGITIHESNASSSNDNRVFTHGTGSLSTTGIITITAANSGGTSFDSTSNVVQSSQNPSATLTALGIEIIDSGTQTQFNDVYAIGAAMSIGVLGIDINGSGSGYHANTIAADAANSPITVAGSVRVTDIGSGHSEFDILSIGTNSSVTIGGNVYYNNLLNTTSRSDVYLYGNTGAPNAVMTVHGSVLLYLAQTDGTASDNRGASENSVFLGGISNTLGYGSIVDGATVIIGGNGQDTVEIKQAQLKLGATINLLNNPSPGPTWHDELEIDGSLIGGGLVAMLGGPNAEIDINNGVGDQSTVISGLFQAIMLGSDPLIYVSNGSGSGYSPVTFGGAAEAIGSAGGGGLFKYHAANVSGAIIPVSFTKVAV
jgi:hypothetical protein